MAASLPENKIHGKAGHGREDDFPGEDLQDPGDRVGHLGFAGPRRAHQQQSVGGEGVLRLEIGGSSSYVLSCLSSETEAPAPSETAPEESTPADAPTVNKDELVDIEDVTPTEPTEETNTVAGIPVTHIVLFGGGLLVAVGALIGINFVQKRRAQSGSDNDDENDEF